MLHRFVSVYLNRWLLAAVVSVGLAVPGSSNVSGADPALVLPHNQPSENTNCAGSACGACYWIVSTRPSPQSFVLQRPKFCPRVTRICSCGSVRPGRLAELKDSLIPGLPVCIKVHGSFVSPTDVEAEAQMTHRWLSRVSPGQPLQLIHFAWPSSYPLLPTIKCDSTYLGRRAARNGWYLAEFLQNIPADTPICLIGHSHGCRLIASALHLMAGGRVQGHVHPWSRAAGRRIRVVFAASAMRHDWLNPGEKYGRAMQSTESLLNLRNRHDAALMLYPLRHPFSGHSMATMGINSGDRSRLGRQTRRVFQCDVTHLIGYRHMWPGYVAHPQLAWTIRNYVFFPAQ